jgi:hypothetical protein
MTHLNVRAGQGKNVQTFFKQLRGRDEGVEVRRFALLIPNVLREMCEVCLKISLLDFRVSFPSGCHRGGESGASFNSQCPKTFWINCVADVSRSGEASVFRAASPLPASNQNPRSATGNAPAPGVKEV